jgi:hypothetical protein
MSLPREGATKEMGAAAGLHRHDADRESRHETYHALAGHPSTEHHCSARIQSGKAAAVLTQINSEHGDRRFGHGPLLCFQRKIASVVRGGPSYKLSRSLNGYPDGRGALQMAMRDELDVASEQLRVGQEE